MLPDSSWRIERGILAYGSRETFRQELEARGLSCAVGFSVRQQRIE